MSKKIFSSFVIVVLFLPTLINPLRPTGMNSLQPFWNLRCVDTMKVSRDSARDWQDNARGLDAEIKREVAFVKKSGANCISLGTPYSREFVPFLTKWVRAARTAKLHVWFRGNIPEWEGWFGFPKFKNAQEHHRMTYDFVTSHPDLFSEGDIFTPAPEPENGALGDPRASKEKAKIFNEFLIKSYANCEAAFAKINIAATCGYFSTNYDVANLVLTRAVVEKIGKVVVIDHYVKNPDRFLADIDNLQNKFGAKIVIGEFGAPIPDLNGNMNENQQAAFIEKVLVNLYKKKDYVAGVNYWTLTNGTTSLFKNTTTPKKAFAVLKSYYAPTFIHGTVFDPLGDKLGNVKFETETRVFSATSSFFGSYYLELPSGMQKIIIQKTGYKTITINLNLDASDKTAHDFILTPTKTNFIYQIRLQLRKIFSK
jgi:hypothetical protein